MQEVELWGSGRVPEGSALISGLVHWWIWDWNKSACVRALGGIWSSSHWLCKFEESPHLIFSPLSRPQRLTYRKGRLGLAPGFLQCMAVGKAKEWGAGKGSYHGGLRSRE